MMEMREKQQADGLAFRQKRAQEREKLLEKTRMKHVDDGFDNGQGKHFEVSFALYLRYDDRL